MGYSKAAYAVPRSLYVWDATPIVDATKQQSLFNLCQTRAIGTLFIYTGSVFVEAPLNAGKVQVTRAQLGSFVTAAHAINIKVHALDGDPSHALTANHSKVVARLNLALDYNLRQASAARLDGFQWDVEPWLLSQWQNGDDTVQDDITTQFLNLVTDMKTAINAANPTFALGFAAPFWFDDPTRSLAYNGLNKVPFFHMVDILKQAVGSYIAVMAYRDTAPGSNGTIGISQGEINYASTQTPAVKIWIAQETVNVSPASITFYGQPASDFETAVTQINTAFSPKAIFAGIAIHDWPNYVLLLSNPGARAASAASAAHS